MTRSIIPPLSAAQAMRDRLARLHHHVATATEAEPVALDADHPLVKAFGADQARALLDGRGNPQVQAIEHRRIVEELSRAGKPVREIAQAAGLSMGHVVALRAELGVGRRLRSAQDTPPR